MNVFLRALLVLSLPLVVACGRDDGPPVYVSGVQATDASVASLPQDQREQLCSSLNGFVDVNVGIDTVAHALCLPSALILGGRTVRECQAFLDDCVRNFPLQVSVTGSVGNGGNVQTCAAGLRSCNANVGSLEACVNVHVDDIYYLLDSLACSRAGDPATVQRAQTAMGVNTCASLGSGCSGFVEPVTLR